MQSVSPNCCPKPSKHNALTFTGSTCVVSSSILPNILGSSSFPCWRVRRRLALGSVLPLYYLYAWVGHFFVQRDIPAVFTYGMTLRGWASGEFCSVKALVMGRTVRAPGELALTAAIS